MARFSGLSPMLRHALESFEHGILHYLDGTDLGRKFALLHVDHSIELVLKEKIARTGQSIFRKNGKTIGVHEAYAALSNISIPEKPRLEDLHDFRNIVQHKGLTPDEHTTEFYITEAYNFVKRFLKDELGIQLDAYLPHRYIMAMEGLAPEYEELTEEAKRRLIDAEQLFSSGAHEMAVISAFVALEITVRERTRGTGPSPLRNLMKRYVDTGVIDNTMWTKFRQVYDLRNKAAHTGGGISREEARKALDYLNEIIDALSKET